MVHLVGGVEEGEGIVSSIVVDLIVSSCYAGNFFKASSNILDGDILYLGPVSSSSWSL